MTKKQSNEEERDVLLEEKILPIEKRFLWQGIRKQQILYKIMVWKLWYNKTKINAGVSEFLNESGINKVKSMQMIKTEMSY